MISKRSRDVSVKSQGFTDEAIVAVKPIASEGTVTYLRVKLSESDPSKGWR